MEIDRSLTWIWRNMKEQHKSCEKINIVDFCFSGDTVRETRENERWSNNKALFIRKQYMCAHRETFSKTWIFHFGVFRFPPFPPHCSNRFGSFWRFHAINLSSSTSVSHAHTLPCLLRVLWRTENECVRFVCLFVCMRLSV